MIVCQMHACTQQLGGKTIFEQVSWEMKQGERVGLIGRNGEGKTTLLHLLAGRTAPQAGTISWKKDIRVGLLEQRPVRAGEKSVLAILSDVFAEVQALAERMQVLEQQLAVEKDENRLARLLNEYGKLQESFAAQGGYEQDAVIRRVTDGLQLNDLLGKQWHMLSGGERTKVGLAQLLLQQPDLLLLDEPTNHLDLPAIEWLTDWMRHYEGTVVIVSHDRTFLDEAVQSIVEIEQGKLHHYHGNYSYYVEEKEARVLLQFKQYEDQQKKMKKMRATIKRLKEWANRASPPNAGMHRQAKSMEKALAKIEQLERPPQEKAMALSFAEQKRSGQDVLRIDGVEKTIAGNHILRGTTLSVRHRERVAIVGGNGAGKSTLLRLLLGQDAPDAGDIQLGAGVSCGYLSQHYQELDETQTVLQAFRASCTVTEGEARGKLAQFLFYGHDVFQKVAQLSGGEKMRLRLAQLMYEKHNVLILDEPTNHLDIASKEALEEALALFPGTIVVVSHDRYFLNKLFPVTCWLEDGKLTRYEGNFAYARMKREANA
ncbi:ABC-F type ribosomal protection protein [Bacillus sp. FSL W7-1360]